jgi:hypothetical protein
MGSITKNIQLSSFFSPLFINKSNCRLGDVFIPYWNGFATAFDVAVTSLLSQTAVRQAASSTGAALCLMESKKQGKYVDLCHQRGIKFIPLVVETLGGWDDDAVSHLREIAKRSASRSDSSSSNVVRHLFQRLAILLQRANAGLIDCRGHRLADAHLLGKNLKGLCYFCPRKDPSKVSRKESSKDKSQCKNLVLFLFLIITICMYAFLYICLLICLRFYFNYTHQIFDIDFTRF